MDTDSSHREACADFCKVTGLNDDDISIAQFYLEETDWKVQEAVKNYWKGMVDAQKFDDPELVVEEASNRPSSGDASSVASCSSATGGTEESHPTVQSDSQHASVKGTASAASTSASTQNKIRLVTWNIDGLDQRDLGERTVAVCETLKSHAPDIVYLQEVISPTCSLIASRMKDYLLISAGNEQYFTAILLKKSSVKVTSEDVYPFPGSSMGRALQIVQAKCSGIDLILMCSHLESTKQHAKERMNQLKIALDHMRKASATSTVIFGGDCNLRDTEVTKIGGLPLGIFDIWQLCGEPKDAKFTWDLTQNYNLDWPYPNRPRCRFDRLYLRHCSQIKQISAEGFTLTGKKKVDKCAGRFPSDHWGIVCDFSIDKK